MLLRYAEQVSSGDEILVQANDELTPARITDISVLMMQGRCYSLFSFYAMYSLYFPVFLKVFSSENNVSKKVKFCIYFINYLRPEILTFCFKIDLLLNFNQIRFQCQIFQ